MSDPREAALEVAASWRDGENWAPRISALLAIVFLIPFLVGSESFCLDDAWIHLGYAKSLRLGDGLSYNPGDWETGFSSPLWVLVLAVWPTGTAPVMPVKLLGMLLHAATAWLASVACLDLGRARASVVRPVPLLSMGLLGGTLTAGHPLLLQAATSGMEVSLTAALILGLTVLAIRRQLPAAAGLCFAAVLTRPEALFFIAPLAGGLALARRRWHPLMLLAGGMAGLGIWVSYCLAVSGWPWPNTAYVKASGGLEGLGYLASDVLPSEPWLVGLGGVVLIGLALRHDLTNEPRRLVPLVILGSWAVAMLGVAFSRPLHPGVLFFEARYFAPFAGVPAIVVALGLVEKRLWIVVLAALPVALMTGWQARDTWLRTRAQETDIELLHVAVSRHVRDRLPGESVVAVEGAGAMRWFTPRTMTIVDLIGLNDAEIAHAPDDAAKACVLVRRKPDYLVAPRSIASNLDSVFETSPEAEFLDPDYAQVEQRHAVEVVILKIEAPRPAWVERCSRDE